MKSLGVRITRSVKSKTKSGPGLRCAGQEILCKVFKRQLHEVLQTCMLY